MSASRAARAAFLRFARDRVPAALGRPIATTERIQAVLTALESLVRRHRALELSTDELDLHAELIAAEVAHQFAVTRSALQRSPAISRQP